MQYRKSNSSYTAQGPFWLNEFSFPEASEAQVSSSSGSAVTPADHGPPPAAGAPEAVAGGPGGQRDVPRADLAEPRGEALPDPLETRDSAQPPARGGEHHLQGERGGARPSHGSGTDTKGWIVGPGAGQASWELFAGTFYLSDLRKATLCTWMPSLALPGMVLSSLTLSHHQRPDAV